jgi:hypothetical protein
MRWPARTSTAYYGLLLRKLLVRGEQNKTEQRREYPVLGVLGVNRCLTLFLLLPFMLVTVGYVLCSIQILQLQYHCQL